MSRFYHRSSQHLILQAFRFLTEIHLCSFTCVDLSIMYLHINRWFVKMFTFLGMFFFNDFLRKTSSKYCDNANKDSIFYTTAMNFIFVQLNFCKIITNIDPRSIIRNSKITFFFILNFTRWTFTKTCSNRVPVEWSVLGITSFVLSSDVWLS